MKKIALATAAVLFAATGAFAQTAVAPQYNKAGYLPTDVVGAQSTGSAHGFSATVPAGETSVAPAYNSAGYLATDVVGARSTAINPGQAPAGVAVAPQYDSAGRLPTDVR